MLVALLAVVGWPERCLRITGRTARVTFIGPISPSPLVLSLPGRQFLEVAPQKLAALLTSTSMRPNSRLDDGLGVIRAGDIQLHNQTFAPTSFCSSGVR